MTVNKVFFDFDPFEKTGVEVSDKNREKALQAVIDFVLEQELLYIGSGRSPVAGGEWKKSLSKEYKAFKKNESSVGFANLELTGAMLDALEVIPVNDSTLRLQIQGKQAGKADGHNNHSGDSTLPPREFIPREDQTFRRDIWAGIESILKEYADN